MFCLLCDLGPYTCSVKCIQNVYEIMHCSVNRDGVLQKRKVSYLVKNVDYRNHCSILLLQQLINLTLFTDVSPREQLALVHAFKLPTPYVIVKECINVSIAYQDSTEHGIDT